MKLKGSWLLLLAWVASACGEVPPLPEGELAPVARRVTRQQLPSTDKVLILDSTVSGGLNSREALAVSNSSPGTQIDVLKPEEWRLLTAEQFMEYRTLIIGDAGCQSGEAAFQAAIDTRRLWGAIIDGDVVIVSTDPTSNHTRHLVENAIQVALDSAQYRTGMYISLGCAYQDAPPSTVVTLLEPFGHFKVDGVPGCPAAGHFFRMQPPTLSSGIRDVELPGDGCVARSVFTSYPDHTFAFAALATGTPEAPIPGERTYIDYLVEEGVETEFVGTPYVLVKGAAALSAGCGDPDQSPPDEECDLGDNGNGQPAPPGGDPESTCSFSCHQHWCGDGVVDEQFGEECDQGSSNGRSDDSEGNIGTCTGFCKIPDVGLPNRPPVALCRDVTVVATNTCDVPADINNGSNDPDGDLVGCVQNPPGPYLIGSTRVTLTCRDQAAQIASCTGIVTVTDLVAPAVTLEGPASDVMECTQGATYPDQGATARDICEGPLPVTASGSVDMGSPGSYSLTYSATDSSGNVGTATRTVAVNDTLPPTVTLSGSNPLQHECGAPFIDPGAQGTDQCAGTLVPTASGTVDDRVPGSYSLRYSVSDPTGHSAAQDRVVAVSDTLPPSITVQGPMEDTLECGSPYVDPGATADDLCAGPLPVTTTHTGSSDRPGTFTLSYSAIDPAGHEATSPVSRTVNVVDETPPVLTLVEPVIQMVECATPWSEPGVMASDACFGDLTSDILLSGAVNTATPGSYPLTYSVTDPAGHSATPRQRTVNVQDTLAPSITIRGSLSVQLRCDHVPYVDPSATATDLCAGDLTGAVQRLGSVDTGLPGSYTLRYQVADPSGNQTTSAEARTVSVVDDQPPTIALNGPSSAGHECGSVYDDPGATANDVCAGDLTGSITRTGSVDTGAPGSYTLRYTVTDPANLSASTQRTVNVQDTLAPTLSLRGPASELVECGPSYVDPGATATDICAGNLDAQVQVSGVADSTAVGDYNVTYTVSDFAGNAATPVSRQVQVRDTTAPTLSIIEPVEAQVQCGTPYEDPGARAMDTCAGDLTSAIVATRSGDSRRPGSFTITYSVQDPSGNRFSSPIVRTVSVRDDLPPTLTLVEPATQTVECATPWNEPGVTASDLCFGDLTSAITRTGTVSTGTPADYTLMYSVVDGAGNSASSVSRSVQVRDTLAPSITIEGTLTQRAECGSAYADPGATARDACAGDMTAALETVGTVNTGTPGSYSLRYRVTDPSGNQTTSAEIRTVTVVDEQPPTLELLGSASMRVECGSPYDDPGAKARDACAGDLSDRITRTGTVNPAMPGAYTISYSVSDPSNNRVTLVRDVSVADTQPPSIVCPEPLVVETPEDTLATVSLRAATATDVCSQAQVSMPTETQFPVGTTEVTYTATDLAGNSAKCTTTVTVLAIAKPIPDLDRALIGGGNGCSSTGGGPSSLAMIGLGVLASLLARKRTRAVLPVLAVLVLGSKAVAQPAGIPPFELERLMLNPSGRGSLLLGTGELLPHGEYRLSLTSHYENDPLLLVLNGKQEGTVVQHRATMHLAAAYGLWGWVEIGAQVPVVLLQRGDDLTDRGIGTPRGGLSVGTPVFSAQLKLLSQREDDLVDLSLGVHAGPAVGSAAALAREFRGTPTVMVGRRFEHLQTAIDAGIMFRRRTILSPDAHVQDEIGHALRLGATLSSLGEGLRGEVAILGSVPLKREGSSVETLAGARYPMSEAFEAYALAGLGFGTAAGTPDFRVLLGVAFERPRPPAQIEVAKYEPELPPPMDSDADGVLDDVDQCPTVPGLVGLQGCPDQDGDGVEDGVDRCLGEAGPVDRQGCPERDSDGDGLVDGKDSCPTEAGPLDRAGCPVPDKDHDTVEDLRDNCPDEAGPPDNQGCPEEQQQLVVIQSNRIAIKDTVYFDFNKATIQPRSYGLLDQVARVLLEHPEIIGVSIEGHTDGVGPAEYNRGLSQRRSEAVRDYLAGKGVAPERMQAKGFGEDRPVQSNATSAGRAANRRVEFITRYEPEQQ